MLVLGGEMAGAAIAGPVSYDFTSISVPGSLYTVANGINNVGDVVGGYPDYMHRIHGFLLDTTGHLQTIDVPGAYSTTPQAINNSGEIVGSYSDAQGTHGFLDKNGVFTTIDPPGSINSIAPSTVAYGINSSGQISGTFSLPDNQGQNFGGGFVYENGVFTTIMVPGFQFTGVQGINDAGDIVGSVSNSFPPPFSLGFLDVNGNYTFIDVGGNHFTEALGINNARDIVGNSTSGAFLLDVNGSITTIELPGAGGTTHGINDQGVIVGPYAGGDCPNLYCGYIGTPVPEPSSLGLVGAILLAFAASLGRVGHRRG
jgi:uncharacterized membrane protein